MVKFRKLATKQYPHLGVPGCDSVGDVLVGSWVGFFFFFIILSSFIEWM